MGDNNGKFPLLEYLDELVDDLRELAPRAIAGNDAEAVHDARVATRRLKAAMELLQPVVPAKHQKPITKVTRSLRKRLGEVRDLDVMLEHLGKLKSARHAGAIEWLRPILEKARQKAVETAAEHLAPAKVLARLGCWWGLRQEVLAARDAVGCLLSESIHLQLDGVIEQVEKLSDPHPLRIAAKALRYTLEMAKEQEMPLPKSALGQFRKIQDALGLWHDYVVLAERIMAESADAMLAHHHAALQQATLALASAMIKRSRQQLEKVGVFWKKDGEALAHQIREAFPLTEPAENPAPPAQQAVPNAAS